MVIEYCDLAGIAITLSSALPCRSTTEGSYESLHAAIIVPIAPRASFRRELNDCNNITCRRYKTEIKVVSRPTTSPRCCNVKRPMVRNGSHEPTICLVDHDDLSFRMKQVETLGHESSATTPHGVRVPLFSKILANDSVTFTASGKLQRLAYRSSLYGVTS